jgi:PAS domain S-box-containing protein
MHHNSIMHIYHKNIQTINENETLQKALERMTASHESAIVVMNDEAKPTGIITEKDISKKAGEWNNYLTNPVSSIMSTILVAVTESTDFRNAYMRMSENGFRHLLVTDDDGKLVGILTEGDFLEHLKPIQLQAIKEVHLVMSTDIKSVSKDATLAQAVQEMNTCQVSSIVIMDAKNPVGILSERDFVKLAHYGDEVLSDKVTQHMSSPLKSIYKKCSVLEAEKILRAENIRRLTVIDDEEKLVGIITQHDLVKGISGTYVEMLRDTIKKQSETIYGAYNRLEEQSVLENILDTYTDKLIIACDKRSIIEFSNADIFKCSQTLPRKHEVLDEQVPCFDKKMAQEAMGLQKRETIHANVDFKDKDGVRSYFKTSYTPLFSEYNLLKGFLFTAENITDEVLTQKKEQHLLRLIDASSNEFYVIDAKSLKFSYANRASLENLQYSLEEIQNQFVYNVKPEYTKDEFLQMIQPLLSKEISELSFESEHLRKDGTFYPVQVHLQLLDADEEKSEFLAIVLDITERKKQEQKLQEQEELMFIQSRQAAMGEMISMIAHQWRQPLSVVSLAASNILLDIEMGEDTKEKTVTELDAINKQVQYMSHTIDDFRNFFKPSKRLEKVKLKNVIEDVVSIVETTLKNNDIRLQIACEGGIEIETFTSELKQILISILSNAKDILTKSKQEEKYIHISVERFNDDHIILEICNNGPHIPQENIHKIFEAYFTTKESLGGTGLGLFMAQSILQKHMQGSIEAYNKENGVSFKIIVPKELEEN